VKAHGDLLYMAYHWNQLDRNYGWYTRRVVNRLGYWRYIGMINIGIESILIFWYHLWI
jgi:hypothetical protein